MTALHTVARSPIFEQITKHGTLFMSGYGLRLQVQHGHLWADWGVGRDRQHVRLSRVSRELKRVIVVGNGGFATFDAINWIADIGASLIFLDRRGKLLFASTPTAPSDVRLRRAQCLALENGRALKISRELISQKLDGQAAIVRDMLGNFVAADAILRFKADLAQTDTLESVRLTEAQAAKIYWSQWADIPIRWPKNDESHVAAHWKRFGSRISPITRSPRLASNPANACMNLIHALCEAECRIALIAMGLDCEVGLLHCDVPGRSSLANDLQEILRPRVDSFVLNWMQTEVFRKTDFWEDRNGNCRIGTRLAKKLCETSPVWSKFAAPGAEHIARELWNSIRKTAPSTRLIATRLTQSTKRAVKGSTVPTVTMPKHERLCSECGRKIPSDNKRCLACAEQERIKEFDAGRRLAHSSDGIAKRADTMRQHRQKMWEWKSSNAPAWLTRDFYTARIQPALVNVAKKQIRVALGVSEPYSSYIQTGKRIPHPRFWQALAKLVGVSSQP